MYRLSIRSHNKRKGHYETVMCVLVYKALYNTNMVMKISRLLALSIRDKGTVYDFDRKSILLLTKEDNGK